MKLSFPLGLFSQAHSSSTSGSTASTRRIALNVVLDGVVSAAAAPIARWLAAPDGGLLHPLWFVAGGGITLLVSGVPFRMSQQYWRFSGLADLFKIACASVVSACLFSLLLHFSGFAIPTPTFPIIHAMVLLVMLGAVRMAWRLAMRRRIAAASSERILLLGADHDADLFMRALERGPGGQRVVGLLTDGAQQAGRRIHDSPILGQINEADRILERLSKAKRLPDALVVTAPDLRGAGLSFLIASAQRYGIKVQRAPKLTDLQPAAKMELRPIAIEELLNRPPVTLDADGMGRMIRGQVVFVTGAGGSIGSELARQIAAFQPAALILLESSEYALWQISVDISERFPNLEYYEVLADVRDRRRMTEVFATYRPALVFHAAALKHVPLVEDNPLEGLLTNIVGTRIVADAASDAGVRAMVMISTDKAVNPSSLMGASKRCAEIYGQALDVRARAAGEGMRCVTVRFGNVLGSTGSVVPLFRRQLEQGGPLTVTHPDMTRYFMTIPEAVGLVLQAAVRGTQAMSSLEEDQTDQYLRQGGIFVLDMGDPVRIIDLAYQMIRLAGLKPEIDIEIRFTGLRPGEKLFEELFHGREAPVPSDAPGLKIATPRTVDIVDATAALNHMERACREGDLRAATLILQQLVPEFIHNRDGSLAVMQSCSRQPQQEVPAS